MSPILIFIVMISILNKRSDCHPNWCEDNYFLHEDDEYIIGAVFDGCSTGINSHFASTLMKYSFEKAIKNKINVEQLNQSSNSTDYFDLLIGDVRIDLEKIKDQMNLTELHLLSTIIFFMYRKSQKTLWVKFIGDGTIYVNDEAFTNDENNTPDYLTYHLNDPWSRFFHWIHCKPTRLYKDVLMFSICSDGIDSFTNVKNPHLSKQIPVNYLINNLDFANLKNGLNKKFHILTNCSEDLKKSDELYCWTIKDDLTIIRYAII